MDVFGELYKIASQTEDPVLYGVERDDNYLSFSDARAYFTVYDDFADHEKYLVNIAKGKVLELAAGAGRVSNYLKTKFEVKSTDALVEASIL